MPLWIPSRCDDRWKALILEMCRFVPTERPTTDEILTKLSAIAESLAADEEKSAATAAAEAKADEFEPFPGAHSHANSDMFFGNTHDERDASSGSSDRSAVPKTEGFDKNRSP